MNPAQKNDCSRGRPLNNRCFRFYVSFHALNCAQFSPIGENHSRCGKDSKGVRPITDPGNTIAPVGSSA